MNQIPADWLHAELSGLSQVARSAALRHLAELEVPVKDLASLQVDADGRLFYSCAALTDRLPPAIAAALAQSLAEIAAATPQSVTTSEAAVPIATPPIRHSKPGASKVIYLDFNGHAITGTQWNEAKGTEGTSGYRPAVATYQAKPFDTDGDPATFSDSEQLVITRVWARVAEDFKPFDVDVTTEEPAQFTATTGRLLITPSIDANGVNLPSSTAAGVAYLDVFGDPDYVSKYSPAFVYSDKNYNLEHYMAETASHEMGHNLSLSHDGDANEEYYGGHGSGETSWNTIMGGSFGENVTQWSKGDYAGANNQEDDLAIISGYLAYQADDHADTNGGATALTVNGQTFSGQGVIGQTGEKDRFSFTAAAGLHTFTISPYRQGINTHGGNLDVKVDLLDSGNAVVSSFDQTGTTQATIQVSLTAGTYYLEVTGVGNGSPLTGGYSNYGSLGHYSVSSTYAAPTAPSIVSHPSNHASLEAGQTANFYVIASGIPTPTYQWQRLPAGGTWQNISEGGGYGGTTTSHLTVVTAITMNGDQYRCQASNSAGSVNSTAASLTVTAATPPSITSNPYSTSVVEANDAYFNCYASGSNPLAYQWQRQAAGDTAWSNLTNGTMYAGVTSTYLQIRSPTVAMNGDKFRCVISNGGGSATTQSATLTVTAAVAPSIIGFPGTMNVAYGEYLSLYPNIGGTYPFTYQWYKDNVAIPYATNPNYSKSNATQADSGIYKLVVTNVAGSANASVTVTVAAPVAPAITQQPAGKEAVKGDYVTFNINYTGSNPLTFQWYKNGNAIAYANYSGLSLYNVTEADAGFYSVKVTNDAGSVTSNPAELVVLPAVLPKITSWSGFQQIANNGYQSLYLNASYTGTQPMTFQWYKDGAAIPGATGSSYSQYNPTAAHAGVYRLQLTNDAGSVTSPDCIVQWVESNNQPWIDSVRQGDIVYFLSTSPGRIMRYNLATETWLPLVYLSEFKVPTAFLPTAEGVFIVYNKELVRRPLDLAATETVVATSTYSIPMIFARGSLIYIESYPDIVTYNRSTLAAGPTFGINSSGGFSPGSRPVFLSTGATGFTNRRGWSTNNVAWFSFADDGRIPTINNAPYFGAFAVGSRQYVAPDDSRLFDNSGVVYRTSDLHFAGSLGRAFDDLAFLSDGTPVALRGRILTTYAGPSYSEAKHYQLSAASHAIYTRSNSIYSFSAPANASSNPGVTKVAPTAFSGEVPGALTDPTHRAVTIEDAFISPGGVIHLLSNSEGGILRWDAKSTRGFLPSLPLQGRPLAMSYAPAIDRVALQYPDGSLTDLFPTNDPIEQRFAYSPVANAPISFLTMDNLVQTSIRGAHTSTDMLLVYDDLGDISHRVDSGYNPVGVVWQSSGRRVYSYPPFNYNNAVSYRTVDAVGATVGQETSVNNITTPLRFNAEGTIAVTANGRVLNADLLQLGALSNGVADAALLPGGLFTIRPRPTGTEVQKWARIIYEKQASLMVPGVPLRIFRVDDLTVAVLTLIKGNLAITLLAPDLSVVHHFVNAANVPGAPVITSQPAGTGLLVGGSWVLSTTVSNNAGVTYQWRKNGANISGANGSSYAIANSGVSDSGNYSVVVTNAAGMAVSNSATISVLSETHFAELTKLSNRVLGRGLSSNELAVYGARMNQGYGLASVLTELLASSSYEATQIDRVIRLYYATFNRMPDRPGLHYWAGVIASGQQSAMQVATAFATATEFNTMYGSLNNAQFVTQMYRNTLGREPDQGGLDYWTGLLNGGFTRGETLLAFADSEEFKARMANEVEVVRLYTLLFQRMPTGGEVANWLSFLRGEDQTELFLDSAEFASLYPGGLSNAQFVQAMFSGFLLRGAEEASVTYFAGLLTAGSIRRSELIGQIVRSEEYRTMIAPVARYYLGVFLRPPDQAGAAYWAAVLRGVPPPAHLSQAFAGSAEFAASYAGLTNTQFVAAMYRNILGREADAPGLAYWAGLLASAQLSQAGLLQSFVESVEADARFAPDIRTTLHYQTFLSRTPSRGELDYWKAYLTTLREQLRAELLQTMP